MAQSDTSPDRTTVNLRMTEALLADLDATWKDQGYSSPSEFIRTILRDAIIHAAFNRADWKAIASGEVEVAAGETHSSATIKEQLEAID